MIKKIILCLSVAVCGISLIAMEEKRESAQIFAANKIKKVTKKMHRAFYSLPDTYMAGQSIPESSVDFIKACISLGADVNSADSQDRTPLMIAALIDHTDLVKILLAAGANVHVQNKSGRTALVMACLYDHPDVAKILLDAGSDPNVIFNETFSTLMAACMRGSKQMVALLLEFGVDPSISLKGPSGLPLYEQECTQLIAEHINKIIKCCVVCKITGIKSKCGRCKRVHYCSRECQQADWPMHKLVCKKKSN